MSEEQDADFFELNEDGEPGGILLSMAPYKYPLIELTLGEGIGIQDLRINGKEVRFKLL